MKNIAVIQARMGSSRLPGKALLRINNIPIIQWIIERVGSCEKLDVVVFAIPDTEKDNQLYEFLYSKGANIFRGSEHDVLTRFHSAATKYPSENVIRICADNPFIDPRTIDELITFFESRKCDYAYNHIPRNNCYPDGIGAEIVSFEILDKINNEANTNEYREHIFNFIWDNPDIFEIETFNPSHKWMMRPDIRLDIDTRDDYDNYSDCDLSPDSDIKDIISYKDKILSF